MASHWLTLERIARPLPGLGEMRRGLRPGHLANGTVAFLFASTGPVALILTAGLAGGLKPEEIASWISIAFGLGAVITVVLSYLYRQPLVHAWTISGTAIAGAAMVKFSYDQIVGAYMVTGVVMLGLGLAGGFRKLMDWTPVPIVMAMVAGVFIKFGLLAVESFDKSTLVAIACTVTYLIFTMVQPLGRVCPPVLAALIAGAAVIAATGQFQMRDPRGPVAAQLILFTPQFTQAALLELVLPLAISVLALQNAQGIVLMRLARHDPPANTVTATCGAASVIFGAFGAVCACLTAPANAIIMSTGERRDHYLGAFVFAGLAFLFALFAPYVTRLAASVPEGFIYIIAGLAMLRVLQQTFGAAFGSRFALGSMVTFTVTLTDLIPELRLNLFGIGAPFWGLVFGLLTSLLLEREDFVRREEPDQPALLTTPVPPPAPPSRIVLIAPESTPAVRKIRIALAEKGQPILQLTSPPPGMSRTVAENPAGIVPALVVGENMPIYDQRAILDYLEAAVPEPRLFPNSLNLTAAVRRTEALADAAMDLIGKPDAEARLGQCVEALDRELGRREFFGAETFSRADIAAIAFLDALDRAKPAEDWRRHVPGLENYYTRVKARPAVILGLDDSA